MKRIIPTLTLFFALLVSLWQPVPLSGITVTRGYTFATNEQVTAAKLHTLVDSATVTGIGASDIANSSIANAQLAANAVSTDKILDATILGADIADRTITSSLIATGAVTGIELNTNITFRAGILTLTNATLTCSSNQVPSFAISGTTVSAGAGDVGKVPKLDGTGKLDTSVIPASSVLTVGYTSPDQTITAGGTLTLTHSLGGMPNLIQCRLKCSSADVSYSMNDEVIIAADQMDGTGTGNYGLSTCPNATTIVLRFGQTAGVFRLLDKTTGIPATIDATKWVLIVRAWK